MLNRAISLLEIRRLQTFFIHITKDLTTLFPILTSPYEQDDLSLGATTIQSTKPQGAQMNCNINLTTQKNHWFNLYSTSFYKDHYLIAH